MGCSDAKTQPLFLKGHRWSAASPKIDPIFEKEIRALEETSSDVLLPGSAMSYFASTGQVGACGDYFDAELGGSLEGAVLSAIQLAEKIIQCENRMIKNLCQ